MLRMSWVSSMPSTMIWPLLVLLQPIDGADEGRFARAGWAKDDDHLALLHFHVDAVQGLEMTVPFVHVPGDDDWLSGSVGIVHSVLRLPLAHA